MSVLFEANAYTVSELTAEIKGLLESGFADVTVRGEISGLSRPRSGHVYLNLKDANASIRAVLWRSTAERVLFDLADGLEVEARGRLTVYAPRGEYQLDIRKIEPVGVGPLELAFRQLFARLQAEGLFDEERKRPIPRFPRRIVVVTSPTGAAIRDLLQVMRRRWRGTEVYIAPTRVQGAGAAEEIAAAIDLANQVADVDLLIVTRGGGSLEDLWAFNEEVVARAIVGSRVPVVSAVGHEIDVTIADFAADLRALTPSEAGERCVPDELEVRRRIEQLSDRLARGISDRIRDARLELDDLAERADRGIKRLIDDRRHRLARFVASLEALSPLKVLGRGYSLTLDESGQLIRSATSVPVGAVIETRLATGRLRSRVESVQKD
jgi:exodeoxyribonuclease VII large subunit